MDINNKHNDRLVLSCDDLERLLKQMGADVLQMMVDEDSRDAIVDLVPRHARTLVTTTRDCQSSDIPIEFCDQAQALAKGPALDGRLRVGRSGDLAIFVAGYGTHTSEPGYGAIVFLEKWMDELRLIVYSDITREEPLVISLAKAAEKCRLSSEVLKE